MTEPKNKKGFQPGNKHSKGRPKGSPNRASFIHLYATEDDHSAIMRNIIELAKAGDFPSMNLYVSKACGNPKPPYVVEIENVPSIRTLSDMDAAMTRIVDGAMNGDINIDDAKDLMGLLETKGHAIQKIMTDELDIIRAKWAEMQAGQQIVTA